MGIVAALLIFVTALALLLPHLAVAVRRLHDSNFSGWWVLLTLVPTLSLILFVFYCLGGTKGDNRFGPDPRRSVADVFS